MQRDPSPVVITSVPGTIPVRLPADVPSDQLWRDAIRAARQAATAAAELRRALEASRVRPVVVEQRMESRA
jgi:hypothetical protein